MLSRPLHKLDAIAERIVEVQTSPSCEGFVRSGGVAQCIESSGESIEIVDRERRMGFSRRAKIRFRPKMDLHGTDFEPAAATPRERMRFRRLDHSQTLSVEASRRVLPTGRHR